VVGSGGVEVWDGAAGVLLQLLCFRGCVGAGALGVSKAGGDCDARNR
jgi:hypothetical protein